MRTTSNLLAVCALAVAAAALGPARLEARRVQAGPDDVVEVRARLRYATAIVLPEDETILDWVCGDPEYWSVQGAANLAFIKPSTAAAATNVTLVTDKGRVYTLLAREIGDGEGEPDLKLFLEPQDPAEAGPSGLEPLRFEPRGAAAAFEDEAQTARQEAEEAEARARRVIEAERERFRAEYPLTLRFDYRLGRRPLRDPFQVRAIWRDDRFTYIRADPEEAPALYEERDGKPSLVPYDFENGLYVTKRILGDGWLQIGKRQLRFSRVRR